MIDLPPDEFRRLGYRAIDLLADHLAALPTGKCRTPVPADVQRTLLEQPLPQGATDADTLLDLVGSTILRYPMGNGSPRFFAWGNSPPAPLGVLGDLLAAGLNPRLPAAIMRRRMSNTPSSPGCEPSSVCLRGQVGS